MRLDRYTDSNTEWVTNTAVVRSACQSCNRSLLSLNRVISSSAANGSSISKSCGSVTSARAIETRMRMPPDSSRGKARPNSLSPTRPIAATTRARALSTGTPLRPSGRIALSNTEAHGISVGSWNTKPMRLSPAACAREAGHSTAPSLGSLKPAMIRSAVDLPQPEGPRSDMNSPVRTSKSRPASARVPLGNALPTPRSATSGSEEAGVAGGIVIASLLLGPQIEPDFPVDELQRVGPAVIEARFDDA